MSDDPRIEAAARVLREQLRSVTGTEILFPETAALVVMETLAAADRAAWRPISEARDGSPVLVRHHGIYHGVPFTVRWAPSEFAPAEPWVDVVHGNRFQDGILTHCQPLPAPPEDSDDARS